MSVEEATVVRLSRSKYACRAPEGLQFSGGFVILADQTTSLVMDWDMSGRA